MQIRESCADNAAYTHLTVGWAILIHRSKTSTNAYYLAHELVIEDW